MSTLQDPPTPPGRKRFGWHSYAWLAWGVTFAVVEGHALYMNKHGGLEDYQHRTLSENVRWLAATDRDGRQAKFKRVRRLGLLTLTAWLPSHFFTNGGYI